MFTCITVLYYVCISTKVAMETAAEDDEGRVFTDYKAEQEKNKKQRHGSTSIPQDKYAVILCIKRREC